jgi:hypothetical protein
MPPLRRILRGQMYVDAGSAAATVLVAGMGRSGTTWIGNMVNHDHRFRVLFEPFNPARVPEARRFLPIQYVRPDDSDRAMREAAERILSGRLRRSSVDRVQRRLLFRRRLIKEVRCNLMLAWLRKIRPEMPIVLVERHPLAVVYSWLRLGWDVDGPEPVGDLRAIMFQPPLLEDFPVIASVYERIDRSSAFERTVFLWGIYHHVPLTQLPPRSFHVVSYDRMLRDPDGERSALFAYLRMDAAAGSFQDAWRTASSTADLPDEFTGMRRTRARDWQEEFSPAQRRRAAEILSAFNLADALAVSGEASFGTGSAAAPAPVAAS